MPIYQRGDVCTRYEEAGSGFPLLVTPGGGLNSRVINWPTAVFNAMEVFKNDFRCITMDQRNANSGESTGPVPVDNPWDAFADVQAAARCDQERKTRARLLIADADVASLIEWHGSFS
jgi:hypothetical protein